MSILPPHRHPLPLLVALFPVLAVGMIACSSLPCKNPGGPVQNPNSDMHCALLPAQAVDASTCTTAAPDPTDPSIVDPNVAHASVLSDPNYLSPYVYAAANSNEYGNTLFNSAGDDDDCKYHVSFVSDPICPNHDTQFLLKVINKATGQAVGGAHPRVEAFLDPNHLTPNSKTASTEGPTGTYDIGPIRFDAGGTWTVRFHLFENCDDSPSSPRGHAAFYINVPSPK